jgi:hypothetical protein
MPTTETTPTATKAATSRLKREIMCRRCAGWMTHGEDLRWNHVADGSLACVDPETLLPYPTETAR